MSGKHLLKFPRPVVTRQLRKNVYHIVKRTVYTQDVLFGMEDKLNAKRMLELEKSGGPSMLLNVSKYKMTTPFRTGSKAVSLNDDLTRLFGLNSLTQADAQRYKSFPLSVWKAVQRRNGLLEVSFQYSDDRDQWSPDNLLRAIVRDGKEKVLNAEIQDLFFSYLKRQKPSRDDIDEIFSIFDPDSVDPETKRLPKEKVDTYVRYVEEAAIETPSFTDIEYGIFFLGDDKEEGRLPRMQYNMACVLNGGHLIPTRVISTYLSDMLALLQQKKEEEYQEMLAEFMAITKGDTSKKCRSEIIFDALRDIPLFDYIFSLDSDFMTNNVAALAVKVDAYLLNLVKPSEALLVNLQLPYVLGETPLIATFLVRADEQGAIKVDELFAKKGDAFSLMTKPLDKRLQNSVKYCGTPSANICILENPDEVKDLIAEATETLRRQNDGEERSHKIFVNRLNALFDVFSDSRVKLRYLNGSRLTFSAKSDGWHERQCAVEASSFVHFQRVKKSDPVKTVGEIVDLSFEVYEVFDLEAIENYDWSPCWTVQLDDSFMKDRPLNRLPEGFPLPAFYPEHIGAASPLNPINTTWKVMTYKEFLDLTKED